MEEDAGGDHTSNFWNAGSTEAVLAVPPEIYNVGLRIDLLSTAGPEGNTVWVLFVPLDGEENPSVRATW